jgi:hypothetical protein
MIAIEDAGVKKLFSDTERLFQPVRDFHRPAKRLKV